MAAEAQENPKEEETTTQQQASKEEQSKPTEDEPKEEAPKEEPPTKEVPKEADKPKEEEAAKEENKSDELPPSQPKKKIKTMKAIVCLKNGPPKDVLKIVENVPIPSITKPNQVLVKVLYASINPIDYKMINGMMGMLSPKKPEFIAGRDFSGRVIAKGTDPDLRRLEINDLVYGQCWKMGSFAEYCIVEAKNVHKMPSLIDPLNAASIPLVTQTSYQAIVKAKLKKGDKFLILGGSTATGIMGTQIAKKFIECSEVIVTSSQEELCKSLGADRVINYKKEDWMKVLKDENVDAIYDCVGGQESWDQCRKQNILKKNGYYITIVGDTAHGDNIGFGKMVGTGLSLVNRKFWGAVSNEPKYELHLADSKKNLRDISSLIDANKIKPILDPESPFEFEDYMKMFDKSMSHKAKGKLILKISDDDQKIDSAQDDIKEEQEDKPREEQSNVDQDKQADAKKDEPTNDDDAKKDEPKEEEAKPKQEEVEADKEEDKPKEEESKPEENAPKQEEESGDKGDAE